MMERRPLESFGESLEEVAISGTSAGRGRFSPDIRRLADPAIRNARVQQIFPELAHLSGKWGINIGDLIQIATETIDRGYVPEDFEERMGFSAHEGEIIRRHFGDFIFGFST